MVKATDFLRADTPKQSARGFLGLQTAPPSSEGGGGPSDELSALLGSEANFYQPPVDAQTAASLKPSEVKPLDIKSQIAMRYAADDQQRIAIAAKALGVPEADLHAKGGDVFTRDGSKVGGLGGQTPGEAMGNFGKEAVATVASNPASTAGNAALAAYFPQGIASPWIQGGLGGADEAIRRIVGNYFLPGVYGTDKRSWSMADTTAVPTVGLLSGLMTAGVNKAVAPRFGDVFANLSKDEAATAAGNMAKSPIPLTLGQATSNPALLDTEARLRMLPVALDIAKRQAEGQNAAAREAVEGFAGGIGSGSDITGLGRNVVNAAGASLQEMKNARSRAAGPLYEAAMLPGNAPLDASGVVQGIESKLASQGTPEAVKSLLEKAKTQFFSGGTLRDTPEGLQAAKQGLDALIEGLGENEAQAKAALMGVKSDLMDYMTRNIPGFRTANDVFAEQSAPIQAFGDSLLNKVRKLTPDKAQNAPGMMFNPSADNPATPSMVEGWKEMLSLFPQSWQDAIAGRILQASRGFQGSANGGAGNYSGQISKELGGSPAALDMWRAAMEPEQFGQFKGLLDGLGLASQGTRGQSWTFAGGPAMEALQDATMGAVEQAVSRGLNVGRLVNPGGWGNAFRDWRFRKNAPELAELLFNPPPDWQVIIPPDMRGYQWAGLLPRMALAQGAGGAVRTGK